MGWLVPAVAALAAQGLLHLAVPQAPFAPFSLGERLVRQAPGGLATATIDLLGHQALHVVAVGCVAGALALGVALRRATPPVLGGAALVSSLGAAWLDPRRPGPPWALAAGAVAALAAVLAPLAVAARPGRQQPGRRAGGVVDPGRRRLLAAIALGGGVAVLGGATARRALEPVRAGLVIADRPAAVPHDPGFVGIAGLSAAVTPTADHYVVDVDLADPAVPESGWALRVDGAVTHPLRLALADLRATPTVERLVTMCCISNPVGGPLVGNARWTGVPLADLLRQAQPTATAATLEAVAADGYRETYPLPALAGQQVLVAFGVNGAKLPRQHGHPARLLAPGRYGLKSVKWLTRLALLPAPAAGYWEQRGWDPVATIRTQSRIDVPADHAAVPPRLTVAGIAWAGERRVARVEVLADDHGPWRPAALEREADPLGWRRWRLGLQLPPGLHTLAGRAVDGTGQTQAAERLPPHPSGASGYHRIVVRVRPT
jgi:DMSO/TMAO reductase YedYZ molybdopterin-dependent catalytic subunit